MPVDGLTEAVIAKPRALVVNFPANPDNASRWVREYQIFRMETEPNSPMSIRET